MDNWISSSFKLTMVSDNSFNPPPSPKVDAVRTTLNEELFDPDAAYNSQSKRISVISREEADEKGGIKMEPKFLQNVMVCLGADSKGVTSLVIFDHGVVDYVEYIQNALPIALKHRNKTFEYYWTFQLDGGEPHIHRLTQRWCQNNFPLFRR